MIRAFIAIELTTFIREAIERYFQDHLKFELPSDIVRWIPVKNIHLTLHFLGDINEEQVDAVVNIVKQVAKGTSAFDLDVRGVGCFPRPQRPRVIWLGLEQRGEQLMHLHAELKTLLSGIRMPTESRPFHPHLTLGRVKKSAKPNQIATLAQQLDLIKQPELGVFYVSTVHLIRSDLRPHGAEYSHLASVVLGAA